MKDWFKKIGQKASKKIKETVFSAQGFPIVLTISVLSLLFVMFRMKTVELDYKITEKNRLIEKAISFNKDLKAVKAKLLSVKNLRAMAKKHGLSEPNQKQVIVIP